MQMTKRFVLVMVALLGAMVWGACSSEPDPDIDLSPEGALATENGHIGEHCNLSHGDPPCFPGQGTCCGGSFGYCKDLNSDWFNCGSCGHSCGWGETCAAAQCVPACTHMRDCPSGKICVISVGGSYDGANGVTDGGCWDMPTGLGGSPCASDSDCAIYEIPGDQDPAGNPPGDEKLKCCSGHCIATASDPKHCGACTGQNLCTDFSGAFEGCYSFDQGGVWATTKCNTDSPQSQCPGGTGFPGSTPYARVKSCP